MNMSGAHIGIETKSPPDLPRILLENPAFQEVLEEAMRATGCVGSCISQAQDDNLVMIAQAGDVSRIQINPTCSIQSCLSTTQVPVLEHDLQAAAADASTCLVAMASLPFALAIRIPGGAKALLVMFHDKEKLVLNPAQKYVLQAHASHVATLIELDAVRQASFRTNAVQDEARTERLRLLESVAVHARDSIIITEAEPIDLPGPRILYCNAAFTRATGYSAEEVIGRSPRILQGERTDPAARAKLRAALTAWKPVEIEMINYRKDGTEFWVELSIVPVANEKGWFTHWVSVQRDITDRKEAEQLALRIRVAEFENQELEREIQERKHVEAQLLYTAFHDNLTRLRNRAFFMDRLTAALARSEDDPLSCCSVLFLDLDRFKVVNDSLGHLQGDILLKEVARRLKGCIRPHDTLARLGGDEFAVLIEDASDLATPVMIAERIIEVLRAPVQLGRQSIFPSCSIGIAQALGVATSPEELIRDADIAMYEAKHAGYGDYAIFDGSMHDRAVALLALQTDLRKAVDRCQFQLVYQPIVHPATGLIAGFEALVRWHHPRHGTVPPSDFIPVAEQIGLIRQIDRWVMHEACAQLRAWQIEHANPNLRMSINTSAAEFIDPGFTNDLRQVLDELGLSPKTLELEITEGIILYPSPEVVETIAAVRGMGVRVALDDFGTGYSSLSYIDRYPIDTIKIDKSFIDRVCSEPRTQAIVELVIKLGATLGIRIVAEGVETVEQAVLLASIGCDHVQGYHFAKPLAPEDAGRKLARTLPDLAA